MNQLIPLLLYNDECGVCRKIANWVIRRAKNDSGEATLTVKPIGENPAALKLLNPNLSIWDAYATIHLLMPGGQMRLGGEAVAEVFRNIPGTTWFSWIFSVHLLGLRPFQSVLNVAYEILAAARPIFGCESCGTPSPFIQFLRGILLKVTGKHEVRPHLGTPLLKSSIRPS
ncbi:MAG: DUF393 domain-containing protein [Cryobacterium sp.]|nr:DUF393 domain-containing protein [Oligoflexia bacterium]